MNEPGWYPDPYGKGAYRMFDGSNWTSGTSDVPGYLAPTPMYIGSGVQQPREIASIKGPDTTIHFVLTILTCGLWLPIWIIAAIVGKRRITYR